MRNPYIVGEPVTGESFYGREAIIEEISDCSRKALFVMGTRRIGKTSLLRQVEALAPSLFLDFQWAAGSLDRLARQLRREIRRKRKQFPWLPSADSVGSKDVFEILEAVDEGAEGARVRLLLLGDEAEGLLAIGQQDPSALKVLRGLVFNSVALCTVLTATKNLTRLNDLCRQWHTSPFLHGFAARYLAGLTDGEAESLIRQTRLKTPVKASPSTVEAIMERTNSHPFLTQLLCHRLYQGDGSLRQIEEDDLVVDEILAGFFQIDFDHLSPGERAILLQVSEGRAMDEASLQAETQLPLGEVQTFTHSLTNLGYLKEEKGQFAVGNHFLARWLTANREGLEKEKASEVSDAAMQEVVREERKISLEEQLRTHRANLRKLEERKARHGMDVPLALQNEIDYEQGEMERIQGELESLK